MMTAEQGSGKKKGVPGFTAIQLRDFRFYINLHQENFSSNSSPNNITMGSAITPISVLMKGYSGSENNFFELIQFWE
jgi:hypothetical protein